jgi:hypothetical protein
MDSICISKIDKFQTKYIFMLEKLMSLHINIPEIQREIDIDRVDNIVTYQLEHYKKSNEFCFLGELTFANIDDNLFIIDGMHRYEAIKKLYLRKPDYKICVNIIKTNSQLTIENIFCLLNKSEPVPEYIIKTTNDMTKRHIINAFIKLFKKEYKSYISKSKLPRCPHINIDNAFTNLLDSIAFTKYQTGEELFRYFTWVNNYKLQNINLENSNICIQKSENNETKILFLYNDTHGLWMNNESYIQQYDEHIVIFNGKMYQDEDEDIDPTQHKKKKRKTIPKPVRNAVWKKINTNCTEGLCICCENNVDIYNYECGHIISFYNGGSDSEYNLVPICGMCNKSMGTQNMNEFCEMYDMPGKYYFNNNIINEKINEIIDQNISNEMNEDIIMYQNTSNEINEDIIMYQNTSNEMNKNIILPQNISNEMNEDIILPQNTSNEMNEDIILKQTKLGKVIGFFKSKKEKKIILNL